MYIEIQLTEVHAEALEVGCSVAEPALLYFIYNSIVLFLNERDVLNKYTQTHFCINSDLDNFSSGVNFCGE